LTFIQADLPKTDSPSDEKTDETPSGSRKHPIKPDPNSMPHVETLILSLITSFHYIQKCLNDTGDFTEFNTFKNTQSNSFDVIVQAHSY
jgi:hypothetical protein